jgi:hypothetical protein
MVPYLFADFERKRPMRFILPRLKHREPFTKLGKDRTIAHHAGSPLPILVVATASFELDPFNQHPIVTQVPHPTAMFYLLKCHRLVIDPS